MEKVNKVVVITGASSGIGKALALEFARNGYHLSICARNKTALEEVQKLCIELGVQCEIFQADIAQKEDCKKFIEFTLQKFQRIDVLINNAGISMRALFKDCDLEDFEKVMNVNFWGTVYCTKFALPSLLNSKGHIIGISSIAGYRGLPARSGYSASKFAMNGFLESLRTELLYTGVNVLTVAPGFTASNIRNTALDGKGNTQKESPLDESQIMPAEECAKHIYKAYKNKKRTLILTTQGKLTVFFNRLFSGWMDKKVYQHFENEPNSPLKRNEANSFDE